jgi:hypothetical protein
MMTQKARPDNFKRTYLLLGATDPLYLLPPGQDAPQRNSSEIPLTRGRSELTEGRGYSICP